MPVCFLLLTACGPDPVRELTGHFPVLNPDVARHLVHDDDDEFLAFVREIGWSRAYAAIHAMTVIDPGTLEDFRRRAEAGRGHRERVIVAMGKAFDLDAATPIRLRSLDEPVETQYAMAQWLQELHHTEGDTTRSVDRRLQRIRELAETCPVRDGWIPDVFVHEAIAGVLVPLNAPEAIAPHKRAVIDLATRYQVQPIACQALGVYGVLMAQMGHPDSALYYWHQGLDLAVRHGIGDQAARLATFLGNHHAGQGRWVAAGDYFEEARRLCRELKADDSEIRYLVVVLDFAARLGNWGLVERELREAGVLLRRADALPPIARSFRPRILELQAGLAMHQGDLEEGERRFREAEAGYEQLGPRMPLLAWLYARWAHALLDAGEVSRAADVARRGLDYCRDRGVAEFLAPNAVALATAEFRGGRTEGFLAAMAAFREAAAGEGDAIQLGWTGYDALSVRWNLARGDTAAAASALRTGLDRLESTLSRMESSPETFLFLARRNQLRAAMHTWAADDPALGWRIEEQWRRASFHPRSQAVRHDLCGIADWLVPGDGSPGAPAADTGSVRMLFYLGDPVIRWTRDARGIRRDELDIPRRELERKIEAAVTEMSHEPADPDRPPSPDLQNGLRDLARVLLPPEILEERGDGPRSLYLGTDGALAGLPFGALNTAGVGYRPLIADWDVVLHHEDDADRPSAHRGGLVVTSPDIEPELRRLHGSIPDLPFSDHEADLVRSLDPAARLLRGAEASKPAVLESWAGAGYIYFATHVVHDPGQPSLSFIPLAPGETHEAGGSYIEVSDVLQADLAGCRLVVLSGCASGASGTVRGAFGTSLADAFLIAGAGAVVQTAWHVRDDQAAAVMSGFLHAWRVSGREPPRALCETVRAAARWGDGYRHPFSWAAYGVVEVTSSRASAPESSR